MVAAINRCKDRRVLPGALVQSLTSNLSLIEEFINSFYKIYKTSLDQFLQANATAEGLNQIKYQLLSEIFLIAGCYQLAIDSVTCTHDGTSLPE